MGSDSIEPFLEYKDHAVFLLCLTSNPASKDLQKIKTSNGKNFYEEVANFSKSLNVKYKDQVGLVVGQHIQKSYLKFEMHFLNLPF